MDGEWNNKFNEVSWIERSRKGKKVWKASKMIMVSKEK